MPKNPLVHINEMGPQFTRNMLVFEGVHLMTKMEHFEVAEVAEIGRDLKKRLRAMVCLSTLSINDMCLVPDLVIPQKFKVPNFKKYKRDN